MKTNDAGLHLIRGFESYEPEWYDDPVGIPTVGYGHTGELPDGFEVPLSLEEAERLLRHDLRTFERCVEELVEVPLTENQFSALVSFAYNVGCGALAESTLLRLLNDRRYDDAADELLRWVYAGGRPLRGLRRRREAERALFYTPGFSDKVLMATATYRPDPLPPEPL